MVRITISGSSGSGKSTAGDYIAEKLGLKRYSIGDFRRKMAVERGMTLAELNKLGEKEGWTDKIADDYQKSLANDDDFVIDSRLGWHFIPDSIKMYLEVSDEEGARRIFLQQRGKAKGEKRWENVEEVEQFNAERKKSDLKRYKRFYRVNPYETKNYDIIINTTGMTMDEMKEVSLKAVKRYMEENNIK